MSPSPKARFNHGQCLFLRVLWNSEGNHRTATSGWAEFDLSPQKPKAARLELNVGLDTLSPAHSPAPSRPCLFLTAECQPRIVKILALNLLTGVSKIDLACCYFEVAVCQSQRDGERIKRLRARLLSRKCSYQTKKFLDSNKPEFLSFCC